MTITATEATRSPDGTLIVTGTEFTKTTTTVYLDDLSTPFTWISAEQIIVTGAEGAVDVTVEKGGVSQTVVITEEPAAMAAVETPPADAPATTDAPATEAITPGTWPSPIDGFRAAVAGVALVGLIPVGDEKTAYPTGTPCPPGSRFWLQHGFYKSATPT